MVTNLIATEVTLWQGFDPVTFGEPHPFPNPLAVKSDLWHISPSPFRAPKLEALC